MKIDSHSHFYPKEYLKAIKRLRGLNMTKDAYGRIVVEDRGARFLTITEPMYEPEMRIGDMDEAGRMFKFYHCQLQTYILQALKTVSNLRI